MLLRVAARLWRDSRVGSYVVCQARFTLILYAAAAEPERSIGMSVRGGRRHYTPNYGTVYLRRQEAGFDDEGLGRQGVDERGRN